MLNYIVGERCYHGLRKASCELCELQSENLLLKEQVEDMQCCGNCGLDKLNELNEIICKKPIEVMWCEDWQTDTLARKDRIAK